MSEWKIIKGNTSVQDIPVYDKDDNLLTNLADATEVKFVVKESRGAETNKIEKTNGDGIEVNTPTTGYLRITLTPTDTTITPGRYIMALQITWSATEKYEVRIYINNSETDKFLVEQEAI